MCINLAIPRASLVNCVHRGVLFFPHEEGKIYIVPKNNIICEDKIKYSM
jgi:hypothetical protein